MFTMSSAISIPSQNVLEVIVLTTNKDIRNTVSIGNHACPISHLQQTLVLSVQNVKHNEAIGLNRPIRRGHLHQKNSKYQNALQKARYY